MINMSLSLSMAWHMEVPKYRVIYLSGISTQQIGRCLPKIKWLIYLNDGVGEREIEWDLKPLGLMDRGEINLPSYSEREVWARMLGAWTQLSNLLWALLFSSKHTFQNWILHNPSSSFWLLRQLILKQLVQKQEFLSLFAAAKYINISFNCCQVRG